MVEKREVAVGILFVFAIVVGVAILNHGVSAPSTTDSPPESTSKVGLAIASSGPTCLDDAVERDGGNVELLTNEGQPAVKVNVTVAHDRGETVSVESEGTGEGVYEIRLRTNNRPDDEGTPKNVSIDSEDCAVGTHVHASGNLKEDVTAVKVLLDGAVVETVEYDGELPVTRELPNPLNSAASEETSATE